MSASREKKKRQELYQSGTSKKVLEPVSKKSAGWKVALYWLIGILFVIAFVVVLIFNGSFFPRNATAMKVGEHKITPAMVNVYYTSAYQDFYNQYADYAPYLIDNTKPLSEQMYDEPTGTTWDDYFMTTAEESIVWAYSMYDEAKKAGTTISEEQRNLIDMTVDSYREGMAVSGFSTLDGYLGAYFGDGVNEKIYREFLEVQYLTSNYYNEKMLSYEFSDEQKRDFYAEHADQYDTVDLGYCYISGAAEPGLTEDEDGNTITTDPTDEEKAAAMDEARAKAQELFDGGLRAMEAYDLRTLDNYSAGNIGYVLPAEVSTWAYEADRAEGDMKIFESGQAVYLVRFAARNNNDYPTRDVLLIQVTPEVAGADIENPTEEQKAQIQAQQEKFDNDAKKKADDLFDTWQDGDATEESFRALAEENEMVNGGLVENVSEGMITTAVSEWLYDESRQAGDCEVFTDYEICYLVYYLGEGENNQLVTVANDIIVEAYNDWYETHSAAYEPVKNDFGMKFVSHR